MLIGFVLPLNFVRNLIAEIKMIVFSPRKAWQSMRKERWGSVFARMAGEVPSTAHIKIQQDQSFIVIIKKIDFKIKLALFI